MISGLAGNIQNRMLDVLVLLGIIDTILAAVEQMEAELPATSSQFSLSISVFILVQGLFPLIWSAISEVKGRMV